MLAIADRRDRAGRSLGNTGVSRKRVENRPREAGGNLGGETWEARDIVAGSMIWASDLIMLEGRRLPINPIEVYGMSTSMRSSKPPTE